MTAPETRPIEALADALEAAIGHAVRGEYSELLALNVDLERRLAALEGQDSGRPAPEAADAWRRLRRKAYTLSEVLRHTSVVSAGLLSLWRNASAGYGPDGRFAETPAVRRLRTEV